VPTFLYKIAGEDIRAVLGKNQERIVDASSLWLLDWSYLMGGCLLFIVRPHWCDRHLHQVHDPAVYSSREGRYPYLGRNITAIQESKYTDNSCHPFPRAKPRTNKRIEQSSRVWSILKYLGPELQILPKHLHRLSLSGACGQNKRTTEVRDRDKRCIQVAFLFWAKVGCDISPKARKGEIPSR